jgi:hypothetical protein
MSIKNNPNNYTTKYFNIEINNGFTSESNDIIRELVERELRSEGLRDQLVQDRVLLSQYKLASNNLELSLSDRLIYAKRADALQIIVINEVAELSVQTDATTESTLSKDQKFSLSAKSIKWLLPLALVGAGAFTTIVKHVSEKADAVNIVKLQEAAKNPIIDEKVLDLVTTALNFNSVNDSALQNREYQDARKNSMKSYFKIKYGDKILDLPPNFSFGDFNDKNEFRSSIKSNLNKINSYFINNPNGFEKTEQENKQKIHDTLGPLYQIIIDSKNMESDGTGTAQHHRHIAQVMKDYIDIKYGQQNLPDNFYREYSSWVKTYSDLNKRIKEIERKLNLGEFKK